MADILVHMSANKQQKNCCAEKPKIRLRVLAGLFFSCKMSHSLLTFLFSFTATTAATGKWTMHEYLHCDNTVKQPIQNLLVVMYLYNLYNMYMKRNTYLSVKSWIDSFNNSQLKFEGPEDLLTRFPVSSASRVCVCRQTPREAVKVAPFYDANDNKEIRLMMCKHDTKPFSHHRLSTQPLEHKGLSQLRAQPRTGQDRWGRSALLTTSWEGVGVCLAFTMVAGGMLIKWEFNISIIII